MSARRSIPRRPGIAAAAAIVLTVILVAVVLVRLFSGAIALLKSGGESIHDPQFAEAPETVTRPPEPEDVGSGDSGEDPSLNWVYEVQTPVDRTAEELSREAASAH